jgi:hypothetical protein
LRAWALISRSVVIARSLSSARTVPAALSAAATRSSETFTHSSACAATACMSRFASRTAFNCLAGSLIAGKAY